ncbi:hypothetical protein KPH14_012190 [Odynerus spinipes]|uniref:Uncharacterized protein n=1 Tax=Odynerus spinipes TaxID=1348599 RepID=A0AAD9RFJ4_9HYME|nr:hypothetical protein KPH14_012190 [Odynerus spinipes]
MELEISHLEATPCESIGVHHKLVMTMIDGKVCNAITQTNSSMRCYICNAKPTEMNDLKLVGTKHVNEEYYKFGLSSLHAWIRSFECFLHIAYNMDFKKWSASTPDLKMTRSIKKKQVQDNLRKELGLIVDIVKQGKGTTNDGNSARRFFADPVISARATGLDEEIIYRFAVILQAIASGERINSDKFGEYAKTTAEKYVTVYGW